MSGPTTRRALFGAAPGVVIAAAALSVPALAKATDERATLLHAVTLLHVNGRRAAAVALAAGMDPADLRGVRFPDGPRGTYRRAPVLDFYNEKTGEIRHFDPQGERGHY